MTHPISKHNQPKQKVEKATPENPRNPADSHDQGADAKSNRKGAGATQNDPNGDVDVVEQLKIAWNFVKNPINTNAVMAIATCVGVTIAALGLIGLVINASLTFGLLKTTREANALAYRPYIGVGGVGVVYQWKDSTGKINVSDKFDERASLLIFRPEIKNFGPVPGVNFVSEFRVFIDEVQEPTAKTPNPSSTLFPGQITGPTEKIGFSDYPGIVSGTKSLRFELAVQYDGPNGHYQECKTERFQHETGGFVDLGECGKN